MPAHPVALAEETRTQHVIGASAGDRVEQAVEVRRCVLAVAVEVHGRRVALVPSDLQPGAERRADAPRGLVRHDPGAQPAADRGRRVARAVVHEQPIERHPAGLARDAGEHVGQGALLVARHDDREAAPRPHRLDRCLERGYQRAAAGAGGRLDAEELRDRDGQLAHGAPLAPGRGGRGPGAPDDERDRALAPVEVAVAADAAPLPVVGHQDHRGVLELSALFEEGEEVAHVAVGLG